MLHPARPASPSIGALRLAEPVGVIAYCHVDAEHVLQSVLVTLPVLHSAQEVPVRAQLTLGAKDVLCQGYELSLVEGLGFVGYDGGLLSCACFSIER